MRLNDLPRDRAIKILDAVDKALADQKAAVGRMTKSTIVASLAERGMCSPGSAGIEKTLLKIAMSCQHIPLNFAAVMGVSQPVQTTSPGLPLVPQNQTTKTAGPTQKSGRRLETRLAFSMSGVNLKAISIVEISGGRGRVHFRDGSTLENSPISENVLSKSCTLLKLGN